MRRSRFGVILILFFLLLAIWNSPTDLFLSFNKETSPHASFPPPPQLFRPLPSLAGLVPLPMDPSLPFLTYTNLSETIHCPFKERLGKIADGGKWICHPREVLSSPSCLVYSFGCNRNVDFERAILEINPTCEIHIFDPTPGLQPQMEELDLPPNVVFHPLGIAPPGTREIELRGQGVPVQTLEEIMAGLGHQQLSLLKIDVEGWELKDGFVDTSPGSVWRRVPQLMIEVHRFLLLERLLRNLSLVGMEVFSKEVNFRQPTLSEISLINPQVALLNPAYGRPYPLSTSRNAVKEVKKNLKTLRSRKGAGTPALQCFITIPFYMGCPKLTRFASWNPFYKACEPLLSQERSPKIAYIFDSNFNSSSYHGAQLSTLFGIEEIHVWLPPEWIPAGGEKEPLVYHDLNPLLAEKEGRTIVAIGSLLSQLKHGNLVLVHFGVGTGLDSFVENLSDLVSLPSWRDETLHITAETSFCSFDQAGAQKFMRKSVRDIEDRGFVPLSKELIHFARFKNLDYPCKMGLSYVSSKDGCFPALRNKKKSL